MNKFVLVFLLVIFVRKVENQSQQNKNLAPSSTSSSSDCKKITCFGSANCTTIPSNNKTKCVPLAQKVNQIEDVIRANINFTEDYFTVNSTWTNSTSNSTASHTYRLLPIILPLTVSYFC